jgi:hypothetical protein
MSSLFELEAIECRGRDVDLRVAIAHPDVPGFPTSRNFGLGLMLDFGGDESPLARELKRELGVTALYEKKETDFVAVSPHYIESVAILETHGLLESDGSDEFGQRFWELDDAHMDAWAAYRVRVTQPEWCAHVRCGARANSAAYDASYGEEFAHGFRASLVSLADGAAVLEIVGLLGDGIPADSTFAFELLLDRAVIGANPRVFDLTDDDRADVAVLRGLAPSYVHSVERLASGGTPECPATTLRVALEQAEWLAHLRPGMAWLSFGISRP